MRCPGRTRQRDSAGDSAGDSLEPVGRRHCPTAFHAQNRRFQARPNHRQPPLGSSSSLTQRVVPGAAGGAALRLIQRGSRPPLNALSLEVSSPAKVRLGECKRGSGLPEARWKPPGDLIAPRSRPDAASRVLPPRVGFRPTATKRPAFARAQAWRTFAVGTRSIRRQLMSSVRGLPSPPPFSGANPPAFATSRSSLSSLRVRGGGEFKTILDLSRQGFTRFLLGDTDGVCWSR